MSSYLYAQGHPWDENELVGINERFTRPFHSRLQFVFPYVAPPEFSSSSQASPYKAVGATRIKHPTMSRRIAPLGHPKRISAASSARSSPHAGLCFGSLHKFDFTVDFLVPVFFLVMVMSAGLLASTRWTSQSRVGLLIGETRPWRQKTEQVRLDKGSRGISIGPAAP
jgi:hypothetical protein